MSNPRHAQILKKAERAVSSGDLLGAEGVCRQVLKRSPRDPEALALMGRIAQTKGLPDEAERLLDRALKIKPRAVKYMLYLAPVKIRQGRLAEAQALFEKARRLQPDLLAAVTGVAETLMLQGEVDRARDVLLPYIDSGTEDAIMGYVFATLEINAGRPERAVEITGRNLEKDGLIRGVRRKLHIASGKAYERLGAIDEAFEAYTNGWRVFDPGFDPAEHIRRIDTIIEVFSAERLARRPRAAHGSDLPIFVVGMPRSGSTLVETIVDAHPRAVGAGELSLMYELTGRLNLRINSSLPYPTCALDMNQDDVDGIAAELLEALRAVGRGVDRVVDKYLDNYLHLGLLSMLFPLARVIDCRRDPLDNCISCYAESLSSASHPYASDLGALGLVYRQHERLMAHWNEVLDQPILTVQYEALVADQETETRRLVEFCGLEWDDACLRFHESGRTSGTLSFDQVRRPMYRSSMGRGQKFAKYLGPLKEALERYGEEGAKARRHEGTK